MNWMEIYYTLWRRARSLARTPRIWRGIFSFLWQGKTVGGWCTGIGGCMDGCTWDRKTPVHLCGMTLRITATLQQVLPQLWAW